MVGGWLAERNCVRVMYNEFNLGLAPGGGFWKGTNLEQLGKFHRVIVGVPRKQRGWAVGVEIIVLSMLGSTANGNPFQFIVSWEEIRGTFFNVSKSFS